MNLSDDDVNLLWTSDQQIHFVFMKKREIYVYNMLYLDLILHFNLCFSCYFILPLSYQFSADYACYIMKTIKELI